MPDRVLLDKPRASATRTAIREAFIALALERRYHAISVSDVVARAGVGKSTFYDHFDGKDDILLDALAPLVLALATAASGRAARPYVRDFVAHLWERRSVTRALLDSTAAPLIQRRLASSIHPHALRAGHADGGSAIVAAGIAAAQLAMLECWLAGHGSATIDEMTDALIDTSRLLRSGPDA